MHQIIFKELEFRNFMSYGNTLNRFEFKDGLTWLYGDNGFGKSTIVEAMTFALLGISYRGGTKSDLRNTKNMDGCSTYVMLTFDVVDPPADPVSYRVIRTISGAKSTVKFELEMLENGNWVVQNKRAGLGQKDFEEQILQFNEVLFKNVIAMNTQETLPFFMLPAQKKRELLEAIINMSMDKWKKANGARASEAQLAFSMAESDIKQFTSEIQQLTVIYKQMKSEKTQNLAELKRIQAELKQDIEQNKANLAEIGNTRRELNEKLVDLRQQLSQESVVSQKIQAIHQKQTVLPMLATKENELSEAKNVFETVKIKLKPVFEAEEAALTRNAEIETEISGLNTKIFDADQQVNSIKLKVGMARSDLERIKNEAASITVGSKCPTCGHELTVEEVESHKAELRTVYKTKNGEYKELAAQQTAVEDARTALQNEVAALKDEQAKLVPVCDAASTARNGEYREAEMTVNHLQREVDGYHRTLPGVDVDSLKAELDGLVAQQATFATIRTSFDSLNQQYNDTNAEYSTLDGQISMKVANLSSIENEIAKAENTTDDAISAMEEKIRNTKAMLASASERLHDASDAIEICKTIANIVSDAGMKKMVFGMFVPAFNKAVQRNINKAGLPFVVTFDDAMNYTFQTMPGLAPNYVMTSQGQKRRLGFAVSMAFRDFVSLVGNFSVNFLSLDEVLDISTDDNGMREMLDIAKMMSDDIGCTVVVTHRGSVVADKFDYKLGVTYDGMYSHLTDIQPMWTAQASA